MRLCRIEFTQRNLVLEKEKPNRLATAIYSNCFDGLTFIVYSLSIRFRRKTVRFAPAFSVCKFSTIVQSNQANTEML